MLKQKRLLNNNFNLFFKNSVEKYFNKSRTSKFNDFIYFEYYAQYIVKKTITNRDFSNIFERLITKQQQVNNVHSNFSIDINLK